MGGREREGGVRKVRWGKQEGGRGGGVGRGVVDKGGEGGGRDVRQGWIQDLKGGGK